MGTSGTYNYTVTADTIIKRALRIVNAISQGEVPTTAQFNEAMEALNQVAKEWIADGMQLWCIKTVTITPVQGQVTYPIGIGQVTNQPSFMKVINAYKTYTPNATDIPMVMITRNFYEYLGQKTQQGDPNQYWYDPPGNLGSGEMVGNFTVFPAPSADTVTNYQFKVVGQVPLQDFDSSSDTMDFPSYYANALTWGLAAELAWENPVPVSVLDRIKANANDHKQIALSFGTEQGSIYFQPNQFWLFESGRGEPGYR